MISVFTTGDKLITSREGRLNFTKESYREKYGIYPPLFGVISPTKACNLQCTGCYATSDKTSRVHMDYPITSRVIRETHDLFHSRFCTISGGEPFLYRSEGKNIFDIFAEFRDMFFLVYTNGTLIDKGAAARLAELGNVTPCISVEGYEKHTDERRGEGTHQKIMKAMASLQTEGVPYGISITATSRNADLLLREDFYDHYFRDLGISYLFQFQMMPVGRGKEVIDLMITPQQRVDLFHLWKKLLAERRYPVADFWNSGALSDGCLAYGRWHGYFYVNWHGHVMPCVFVPFYMDNVNDLYAKGLTLADALHSEFFKRGRKWQEERGFSNPSCKKNGLMPCSIKDHFDNFRENILTPDARAENPKAEQMRRDPAYASILREYDRELERLTDQLYRDEYLKDALVAAMA
jgi:MoaA/NifB/PqqE/SkfB family radical SAM enzyme